METAPDLGLPIRAVAPTAGATGARTPRFSLLSFGRPGFVLSAAKYAEDDDDLVRPRGLPVRGCLTQVEACEPTFSLKVTRPRARVPCSPRSRHWRGPGLRT